MIAVKGKFPKLTPEEYFIWEEKQLLRHEYLSGRVYAMSGGTQNHGRIASNIIFILKGHLRGGGCQVGNSDCRVNIFETKDYRARYPKAPRSTRKREGSFRRFSVWL
ncbi:Uma2 family endonuclease [Planktothrix agardhii 1029]|uniref:Uma2 family endonuclease n=1 Tax=Planktothrix agardhii TaxID=1160 RepID=UPI001F1AF145|nr:Uma2 family endonuclease [Planktothrix agardhii]MCF3591928.1 Uma2 family endonuclease [Planktothrix agardhii 1029]